MTMGSLGLAAVGTAARTSAEELALEALFALVFAVFGYRISTRYRAARGVTPWHLPSLVWALICLVLQPFGIIVELFAEFTTRAAGVTLSGERFDPLEVVPARKLAPSPMPAATWAVPVDEAGRTALFGWYPDPSGRHELRYFDGRVWSDQVADRGAVATDPL
ncbi:MAG TPA: DUF2510 domain-containing protein [Acidimicrobiales bacterium]|nr:DUF2510 domain-containing protein [Acidimicrobiales bacterium]